LKDKKSNINGVRMQRKNLLLISVSILALIFSAFQCSSTELTSAKLYIQQKNYDKALEVLKEEIAKNPKSDEGYYLLGMVYGEKQDFGNMVNAFDSSLAISGQFKKDINNTEVYHWANLFNKGVTYYQRGNKSENKDSSKIYYDKSSEAFEQAIKIEPDSANTYQNLAFVYINEKNYDKAIPVLETLLKKESTVDGYKFLGELLYDKGNKLMTSYKENNNPQDSVQAMEQFNKAIKVLEEGRNKYPSDSDILLTLSNSYIAANKTEVAMDAFKAGVEKEPDNKYYRYNYGVLLLGAKKYAAAEEQFKKAVELDPNYENANYNLAVTYVRWATEMRDSLEAKEDSSQAYKPIYRKALPYLEKVVQTRSDQSAVWELLGKVYAILGMESDATNAFNKADELRKSK
jgi:tetratricopeptide (TPR) repeat protein